MSVNVDRKLAVKKLKSLVITPKSDVDEFRCKIEENFSSIFLPNNVELTEHDYGGVKCDVLIPEVYSSRRIVFYVHGGSFAGGSRSSYRNFCSSLAHTSSSRVIVPEFRLPPTHVYPASIDDIVSAFKMVYAEEKIAMQLENPDFVPQIVIAADGSGASLAIALIFKLTERYLQCIQSLVLLSPWLDFTNENSLLKNKRAKDEVMTSAALHRAADLYTYASNLSNPLVSPLQATVENFIGFPPVYIQMGEKEILLEQVKDFVSILEQAEVKCTLDVWPTMMFMFQMVHEYLPEAHFAVETLGNFISDRREKDIEIKAELAKMHADEGKSVL